MLLTPTHDSCSSCCFTIVCGIKELLPPLEAAWIWPSSLGCRALPAAVAWLLPSSLQAAASLLVCSELQTGGGSGKAAEMLGKATWVLGDEHPWSSSTGAHCQAEQLVMQGDAVQQGLQAHPAPHICCSPVQGIPQQPCQDCNHRGMMEIKHFLKSEQA